MTLDESPFLGSSGSSCTSNSWVRPPTHGTGRRSGGSSERFSSGVVRVEARFADLALLEQGQQLVLVRGLEQLLLVQGLGLGLE